MKKYYILWTYVANFSSKITEIFAESPEGAAIQFSKIFSDDFNRKGTVYVFDTPPVFVKNPTS
jgi:hypothetical protein